MSRSGIRDGCLCAICPLSQQAGTGWGGREWTLKIITYPGVIPRPPRVTINYLFSWRATDAITGDLCNWNRTLNEKPAPPSPADNNPQQYCVSRGVKLMSMFPFIERYITASGVGESAISDCQRSI